ncbi:MAG: SDR family oxidoreductase [Oscillospiraceae bacterium]|nr:SDR family oxidoreductase [Oscillospiraceae bacterium]
MKLDFTGKTAVIFGASRGIGEAIATEIARAGAIVYLAARSEKSGLGVKEKLETEGLRAEACVADVSKYEDVDAVLCRAIRETGRLDIVVNNAGIVCLSSFLDATQEEIHDLININLMGANNGCQAAIKHMIELEISGKIVNTASFAGRHALQAGFSHYGMTKAGVIYLTQAAAYAGAPYNINVNAVCPGIIRSKMWETILDSYVDNGLDRETSWKDSLKTFIPLARGDQKAEDIAYTVAFLCSEYADHITGQSINVDGGAAMN